VLALAGHPFLPECHSLAILSCPAVYVRTPAILPVKSGLWIRTSIYYCLRIRDPTMTISQVFSL
jgi:hypothetical protein